LARKYDPIVHTDDCGDLITDDWDKEVSRFIERSLIIETTRFNIKVRKLDGYNDWDPRHTILIVKGLISGMLDAHLDYQIAADEFAFDLSDPIAFERSVADCFSAYGWNARVTKPSGDQGADVIAEKRRFRVLTQCKLYSTPVGNSAVQDAVAALHFERAHVAVVVTDNEYTESARQLAEASGVVLLHHTQLPALLHGIEENAEDCYAETA
jgi:restriction system protein